MRDNSESIYSTSIHHNVHLFDGFSLVSLGQLNASANSGKFRTTPFTL